MIFGTPVWLWLSLAALIPVFIHLWNRKSGKPQMLGTFRFLPEESFAAAKRIELHEIPLMMLRIVMVVLITFLLSELFWKAEPEQRDIISIVEDTHANNRMIRDENGNLEIRIPPDEIDRIGWWNIAAQADHDFNPRQITIEGRLSTDQFGVERPRISAGLSFRQIDSLQLSEKVLASWRGTDGEVFSLKQQRSGDGVMANVEAGQALEEQPGELRMIINTENSNSIKSALEYVASLWNIDLEEENIPELARIQKENGEFVALIQNDDETGIEDVIESNAWSGIRFEVTNIDTSIKTLEPIIQTELNGSPFLYRDEEGQLVLIGSPDKSIEEWVFVGLGNQLVLEALDLADQISPLMKEDQRRVLKNEGGEVQAADQHHPLQIWLFGLLLTAWLLERILAPKRGM